MRAATGDLANSTVVSTIKRELLRSLKGYAPPLTAVETINVLLTILVGTTAQVVSCIPDKDDREATVRRLSEELALMAESYAELLTQRCASH